MAALGGVVAAIIALPLGPIIECRRKRPVMIMSDVSRFLVLGSVPLAAIANRLTFIHLCLAEMAATAGAIAFAAAGSANLKNLLPPQELVRANSQFEATFWASSTAGPPLGGLLISWLGATATTALDALSFLGSALGISWMRTPEPPPPERHEGHRWLVEVTQGWRRIGRIPQLRALFINAMLFGAGLLLITALMPVFMLRDLGLSPWQYGLALGLPGLGGLAGAICSPWAVRRTSERFVLLAFGSARTFWAGLLPLAPTGSMGLVFIIISDVLLLFCAGVFNPVFSTQRLLLTPNRFMARVSTAWSVSAKSCQALGMLVGGVLAAAFGVRPSLAVGAILMLLASLALPWRRSTSSDRASMAAAIS
jgi:predicted MFS family arabinose efflux permease